MVYNQGRGQIYFAKYKYIYLPMAKYKYDNFQIVKYKYSLSNRNTNFKKFYLFWDTHDVSK